MSYRHPRKYRDGVLSLEDSYLVLFVIGLIISAPLSAVFGILGFVPLALATFFFWTLDRICIEYYKNNK